MDRGESGEVQVYRLDAIGLEIGHRITERFTIKDDDPNSAHAWVLHITMSKRDGWSVRVETRTCLTSTESQYRLEASLDAYEGEERVFARRWDRRVPRDLV